MTVLVTGGNGQLGRHLGAHHGVVALGREDLDVCDPSSAAASLAAHTPRCVIHCAALANVDACTGDPARAYKVNAGGTECIAAACATRGIPFLHISTDYVVGGPERPGHRIPVEAPFQAMSVYARSKRAAEEAARTHGGTIVRVQWVYSFGSAGFINRALAMMRSGESVSLVVDQVGCPTPAPLLAAWLLELADTPQRPPVVHLATRGEATPVEWVGALARARGIEPIWHPVSRATLKGAPRPARSCLDISNTESLFGRTLPNWSDALRSYVTTTGDGSEV
ncbi:MAG: hypothetical protein CL927_06485 [Deltaproteobacteria bacterium]|nr:hypothetical protein [Deltaproteobacteria bacterium]HCH63922.1 hypothetical protein [Deltaproteobacteria bacterium]